MRKRETCGIDVRSLQHLATFPNRQAHTHLSPPLHPSHPRHCRLLSSTPALERATTLTPPPEHVVVPDLAGGPLLDLGFPDSTAATHLQRSMPPPTCPTLALALDATAQKVSVPMPPPPRLFVKMHCEFIVMFGLYRLVVCDVHKNAMQIDCYVLFI
jgi:hypothetical protein